MNSNNPPSPIDFAREVVGKINDWLNNNPVIQTEEAAREAKIWADRAREALRDVEIERETLVKPLNSRLGEINGLYKAVHNTDKRNPGTFDKVVIALRARIEAFLAAEEEKKRQEADLARQREEEARRLAREKELQEREAREQATAGVLDVDIAGTTEAADTAFAAYEKAAHQAAIAEKDAKVRLGGGFFRSIALREREILRVEDPVAAVRHLWPSERIKEAILTEARAFRSECGGLPQGITSTKERSL